jgi:hypothetical protein
VARIGSFNWEINGTKEYGTGDGLGVAALAVGGGEVGATNSGVGTGVGDTGVGVGEVRSPHPIKRIGIKKRSRRMNKLYLIKRPEGFAKPFGSECYVK